MFNGDSYWIMDNALIFNGDYTNISASSNDMWIHRLLLDILFQFSMMIQNLSASPNIDLYWIDYPDLQLSSIIWKIIYTG